MQTAALNAVNDLAVNGIVNRKSCQIDRDLNAVFAVLGAAVSHTDIRRIGKVRLGIKGFHAEIVYLLFGGRKLLVLSGMLLCALHAFAHGVPIEHIAYRVRHGKLGALHRRVALKDISLRRRDHTACVLVKLLRGQPFRFVRQFVIQFTHFGNLLVCAVCPQVLVAASAGTKIVVAVCLQAAEELIICAEVCRRVRLEHIRFCRRRLVRRVRLEHILRNRLDQKLRHIAKTNAVHIMRGVLAVAVQYNNIGYRQAVTGEIGWALDVEPRINILQRSFGRKRRGVFQVVVAAVYRMTVFVDVRQ